MRALEEVCMLLLLTLPGLANHRKIGANLAEGKVINAVNTAS